MTGLSADAASVPSAIPSEPSVEQHSLLISIFWHLLPGVGVLLFVLLVTPLMQRNGLPLELAGSLAILLVLAPLELGVPLAIAWRRTGRVSLTDGTPYRASTAPWKIVLLVPLLSFWFFTASSFWNGFQADFAAFLTAFPDWVARPLSFDGSGDYPASVMQVTSLLVVLTSGVIAPIAEELWFRGYLLPRIDRLGVWAVVLNSVLFAVHHIWTPLVNPGRVLAWLPIVFVVWRTRNIRIGLLVHLITNLFGVMGHFLALFQY